MLSKETSIKTVGLCHEVTICQFVLSLLLDAGFMDITPTVAGVNHLPFITALGGVGHTLPFLIHDFRYAMALAIGVVLVELGAIT